MTAQPMPRQAITALEHKAISARARAVAASAARAEANRLEEELAALRDADIPTVRTCWVCGCTDERACPGGCAWASPDAGVDVCTTCQPPWPATHPPAGKAATGIASASTPRLPAAEHRT